ncbi:MAG: DUF4430 domain-containing protein [Coriobacteriia bacterium]|nr:DUF4430 domain-containing protein [Coriobacteriia bacterium]
MIKKRQTKKMLALLLAACLFGTLVLAGCGTTNSNNNGDSQEAEASATVTITIDISAAVDLEDPTALALADLKGGATYTVHVDIDEEDTILSATQGSKDLVVAIRSASWGDYVTSIDGLEENAVTNESGWTVTLNGESPQYGADQIPVKDGDVIVWIYVTSWE